MKRIFKQLIDKGSEHFFYVGATLITATVRFFYSIYIKAHIEPLEFGIYSTCILLNTYFSYAQLGALNAFNRDYPQLIGAKDYEKAKRYRDTTFAYLLFTFSILAIVMSTGIYFIGALDVYDQRYTYGLICCCFITATSVVENFLCSRVRIDGGFKYTSLVLLVELIAIAIGFIMVPKMGYYALYMVTLLSSAIGIVMYYKRAIADMTLKIDKVMLKNIIVSGIPLLINNLIWTIVDSIDKFVILGFMDAERLGIYSIAQMAFSYMILIPTAMSQLFYVKLGKVYGESGSGERLNMAALNYTLIIATIMSFFTLAAYFFLGPLVTMIMPKYKGGVKAAQILMLALAIYTPTLVNGNILTILKKNAALLRSSVYLCFSNVVFSVGFVLLRGVNIESVAYGTALSYLIRTVILIVQLKVEAKSNVGKMIKSSISPAILITGPGIVLFHLGLCDWLGFAIAIIIALTVFVLLYRNNLIGMLRGNLD